MNNESGDDLFPWETEESEATVEAQGVSALAPSPIAPAPSGATARGQRRDERVDEVRTDDDGSANPPVRDRAVTQREYYSISEVCDMVGLKPHVLRYWETQFAPLNPSKNRSGNRVYQRKEIRLIVLVKFLLYEEKYTVEGARAKLDQLRRTGKLPEMAGRALRADTADLVRGELEQLLRVLTPPAHA